MLKLLPALLFAFAACTGHETAPTASAHDQPTPPAAKASEAFGFDFAVSYSDSVVTELPWEYFIQIRRAASRRAALRG